MKRLMLLLVLMLLPSVTTAQSQFGNNKVQAGSTCPPVTAPLSGAGTVYTCTGTGALYDWTGSAWVVVGGGGSAAAAGNTKTVQYNNAGVFGGYQYITVGDDFSAFAHGDLLINHANQTVSGDSDYGAIIFKELSPSADFVNGHGYGGNATLSMSATNTKDYGFIHGWTGSVFTYGATGATYDTAIGIAGYVASAFSGANVDHLYAVYANFDRFSDTGTWGTAYGFYVNDMSIAAATNSYYFWADSRGVYRIREDTTFNSVAQAIPTLYNPQFTKYTAGAANFERCIPGCQWESNVAVITTEAGAGGGNVLRGMRIGDAGVSVEYGSVLNGTAIKGDTTSAHTYSFQVYDNDTGPAQVTWMTATNGNTPSVVISPPAGGATIAITANSVTSRFIANGSTPAVTDTSANSCGTGTQTIVGTDNGGKVTVIGSSGTSCTVTFATAFANAPACSASNETSANLARATSTASTVVLAGTFAQNDVIAYTCIGR